MEALFTPNFKMMRFSLALWPKFPKQFRHVLNQ